MVKESLVLKPSLPSCFISDSLQNVKLLRAAVQDGVRPNCGITNFAFNFDWQERHAFPRNPVPVKLHDELPVLTMPLRPLVALLPTPFRSSLLV